MDTVRYAIQPTVKVLMSQEPFDLRRHHAKEAVKAVAKTITDLITIVPTSFLQGAIGGPIFVLGVITFSTSLATIGGSLMGTMWTIGVCAGTATVLLTVIPRVDECVRQVCKHLLWILNPQGMQENELRRQADRVAKVIIATASAGILFAAACQWGPSDPFGLTQRFSQLQP